MNDTIKNDIRSIVNGIPFDNIDTANILESHKCLYLLSKLPSQKMKAMVQLAVNQAILKQRYLSCADVFKSLSGTPYAVIKGAILSASIYPNPAYRISGDIDLLIAPGSIDMVKDILLDNGFIQGYIEGGRIVQYTRSELIYQKVYTHQIAAFVKETGNPICPFINIDINRDIMWGEGGIHTDMEEFLNYTVPYEIYGTEVRKLESVYEFVSLCMHHYKDLNSLYLLAESGIKLSVFCDIYYYITKVSPDIAELKKLCDSLGVTDYVTFCLYHTNRIMGNDKLDEYLKIFKAEEASYLLNRIGLAKDEYKYLDFGVSDYIFDWDFTEKFSELLTEKDRRKIETNRKYM